MLPPGALFLRDLQNLAAIIHIDRHALVVDVPGLVFVGVGRRVAQLLFPGGHQLGDFVFVKQRSALAQIFLFGFQERPQFSGEGSFDVDLFRGVEEAE